MFYKTKANNMTETKLEQQNAQSLRNRENMMDSDDQ